MIYINCLQNSETSGKKMIYFGESNFSWKDDHFMKWKRIFYTSLNLKNISQNCHFPWSGHSKLTWCNFYYILPFWSFTLCTGIQHSLHTSSLIISINNVLMSNTIKIIYILHVFCILYLPNWQTIWNL